MAARVTWSQAALDDVDAIADYVSRDSAVHARRVVDELFALADSLTEQPQRGRVVPELEDEMVRERFLYSYRLIYELHSDVVKILAVIHGRRLLEADERFS